MTNANTPSISNLTCCLRCHKFKWMVDEGGKTAIMCNQCKTTLDYMHKRVEDKRAAEKKAAEEAKRAYYANKKEAKRRMRDGDIPKSNGAGDTKSPTTTNKPVVH